MDAAEFERVAETWATFHRRFAPLFGRPEAQDRSEQYLRGLLVQRGERRNAENLAEAVGGVSPRVLQRFLTEAPWPVARVRDRLHALLGERLNAPDGVFVLDDTGFAKQGTHSVGVARQYSGTLGKVGNCQVGVFLGYASARGHALVDARLFLPRAWTAEPARCRAAGVPPELTYQTKPELGHALLQQARATGPLQSRWVTADAGYGEVPSFRDALEADGWWYVLEVPRTTRVFLEEAPTAVPAWSGRGRHPTRPRLVAEARPAAAVETAAADRPTGAWQILTVAEGAQGPRRYQFAAVRAWECRDDVPGRATWVVWRRNLDGSELKHYLSNAPADTALATLATVGALRWTVETGFEQGKGEAGLDEYEVRGWPGWHHHMILALLASAFLLELRQDWGENRPPGADDPASEPGAAPVPAAAPVDAGGAMAVARRHAGAQRAGETRPRPAAPRAVA
jgi:SRSO17 transposase